MNYTVGEIIDKLLEMSNNDRSMRVLGIRQINTPFERGGMFEHHNIGINKIIDKYASDDENPYCLEIVSGGNNIYNYL